MFGESRIGARASGLGAPARPMVALTRRALILRPPLRPVSPPLSAQGQTVPSPPGESQATPSVSPRTARSRRPLSDSSNRWAEKTLQPHPRIPAPNGWSTHLLLISEFCWSAWRGKRFQRIHFWVVSAVISAWGKCKSSVGSLGSLPIRLTLESE